MRALRWRAAITIVGAFLVMGYLWGSGRAGYVVQIGYSMTGDALDGAEVFIDGESVGALELYGRSGRARGFKVEAGTHTVRVVHEHCPGGRHRFGDRRNRYGEGVRRARASRAL